MPEVVHAIGQRLVFHSASFTFALHSGTAFIWRAFTTITFNSQYSRMLYMGFLSLFILLCVLFAVYSDTDGGANEKAINQFYRRAKCSKQKPTFAILYIIRQSMDSLQPITVGVPCFIYGWCHAKRGMEVL